VQILPTDDTPTMALWEITFFTMSKNAWASPPRSASQRLQLPHLPPLNPSAVAHLADPTLLAPPVLLQTQEAWLRG
jgi:hypothetical protein